MDIKISCLCIIILFLVLACEAHHEEWAIEIKPGSISPHELAVQYNVHVNAERVWRELGITGFNVTLAIVDDGVEYNHPDLADNYKPFSSYDFNFNDSDPYPEFAHDDHGTSASGVAAARDNSVCGVGAAFRAGIAGIRLLSKDSTDAQEAGALSYMNQHNFIYSNSWGPIDDGRRKEGPGVLALRAIKQGVETGRGGKGSIFMWAAGNGRRSGDNCNYDGWANLRQTVTIAAVDHEGKHAWYSEECSMVIAAAPSSGSRFAITTTDLRGARGTAPGECTSTFGGTSAAAPLAAGVAALFLEANPELTWRDLQGVIINSAQPTDPTEPGWQVNGAGLRYSHKYGFGKLDAYEGVKVAKRWKNLGPQVTLEKIQNVSLPIPDNDHVYSYINITDPSEFFTVEHVEVKFEATHPRRGDLIIVLTHGGMKSILAEKHADRGRDYNWTFGSIAHWGESSAGAWTLFVKDDATGETGTFVRWTLRLYGSATDVHT